MLGGVTKYGKPNRFIRRAYDQYDADYDSVSSINGKIFEYLVCETLAREGVVPFYYQARFELVPNADFDVVCYHPRRPVVLSMKVSLRERYKQADLEGIALRQVYRNAECYLITLSDEATGVSKKITDGDISGLNGCLRGDTKEFTELLKELKKRPFSQAQNIMPLTAKKIYSV